MSVAINDEVTVAHGLEETAVADDATPHDCLGSVVSLSAVLLDHRGGLARKVIEWWSAPQRTVLSPCNRLEVMTCWAMGLAVTRR